MDLEKADVEVWIGFSKYNWVLKELYLVGFWEYFCTNSEANSVSVGPKSASNFLEKAGVIVPENK